MNTLEIERVQSALRAILNDNKFQTSPQMSSFLEYVVQQTLLSVFPKLTWSDQATL